MTRSVWRDVCIFTFCCYRYPGEKRDERVRRIIEKGGEGEAGGEGKEAMRVSSASSGGTITRVGDMGGVGWAKGGSGS